MIFVLLIVFTFQKHYYCYYDLDQLVDSSHQLIDRDALQFVFRCLASIFPIASSGDGEAALCY